MWLVILLILIVLLILLMIYYIDGTNKIFHYKESKWANPFKVGEGEAKYSLNESIDLYRNYVLKSDLKKDLGELSGKTLGCFCDQKGKCHAKVLVELFNELK